MKISRFQKDILNYITSIDEEDMHTALESECAVYLVDGKRYIVIEITELASKYHEDAHIVFYYQENGSLQIVKEISEIEKVLDMYEKHQEELNS